MDTQVWLPYLFYSLDLAIRLGLSLRILSRNMSVGVTFAWMVIVLAVPYLGAFLYLLIGENRLGERRIARARTVIGQSQSWRNALCERVAPSTSMIPLDYSTLELQARSVIGYPALPGNDLQLLTDYESVFHSLIDDIKKARSSCRLEFYILVEGGLVDDLLQAISEAHERGIKLSILLDSLGSKGFLEGNTCKKMREAGIDITGALRVNAVRMLFQRVDIRNHRKIAVIDNRLAYTGSQNLVDPRFFKQDAGVGEWIDIMVRIEGPSVAVLHDVATIDWSVEAGKDSHFSESNINMEAAGDVAVQVIPSGPVFREGAIHQLLMGVIFTARHELVITTPYYAPDDALAEALVAAANRGVDVTLVIPARVDSRLIRYATPALLDRLVAAGIKVALFERGLLHTKSITVDGNFCIAGSVNMDMRSLWLNFEISLFIYHTGFCSQLRQLQQQYINQSTYVDPAEFRKRSRTQRLAASIMRLFAPVL
jgi:cardiolipin synthase